MGSRSSLAALQQMPEDAFVNIFVEQLRARRLRLEDTSRQRILEALEMGEPLNRPSRRKTTKPSTSQPLPIASRPNRTPSSGQVDRAGKRVKGSASEDLRSKAQQYILTHDMLSKAELKRRLVLGMHKDTKSKSRQAGPGGVENVISQLIAIMIPPTKPREIVYPSFQINPRTNTVYREVLQVNEILDAAHDPWGAASWWLSPHGRINATPASLLNTSSRRKQIISLAEALRDDSY
jgi:hypothetical protein